MFIVPKLLSEQQCHRSLECELNTLLDANWGGRCLLLKKQSINSSLWPLVLERINHGQIPQRNNKSLALSSSTLKGLNKDNSAVAAPRRVNVLYDLLREGVLV